MKTVIFCNLIPNKLGAYEALQSAGGSYPGSKEDLVTTRLRLLALACT